MAMSSVTFGRSLDHHMLRNSLPGRRAVIVAKSGPQLTYSLAQSGAEQQRLSTQPRLANLADRSNQSSHGSSTSRTTALVLSSTTTSAAAAAEASIPTALARFVVGAAVALSTVYALLSSSPASSTLVGASLTPAPPLPSPSSPDSATTSTTRRATTSTSLTATTSTSLTATSPTIAPASPAISSLPILRNPDQFDSFVLAANRAGYLAVVLFHAPWCSASQRMLVELQRLSHLFTGRRVVFARVDCSIKQGVRPGAPLGSPPSPGFKLQRCDLTQLHRIHKTPTLRMYFNNACVDEIIGCRPIDFRQAASDLTFKYNL